MFIRNIYCWCPWIGRRKHIPSMPYKILIYLLSFLSPYSYNFLFRNPYIAGEKYVPLFTSCTAGKLSSHSTLLPFTSSMGEVTIFYLPYQVQPCCCQTPPKAQPISPLHYHPQERDEIDNVLFCMFIYTHSFLLWWCASFSC